jgi:hypothetical protein
MNALMFFNISALFSLFLPLLLLEHLPQQNRYLKQEAKTYKILAF